jgi:hypothetical protein
MELRARIRPLSRRAAFVAALVALVASAVAGAVAPSAHAAKKKKAPVITKVSPLDVAVGEALTIRGRHFVAGRKKNTVVFKRHGARAVFVKADVGTKKMLRVTIPATVQKFFVVKQGNPVPTRFRLRVLAKKFGKKFTRLKHSPTISGPRPPQSVKPSGEADCDEDGIKNKHDDDDDNDLLSDVTESAIGLDACKADTDGDGVEDGYEYQSAKDLNDDEYQGDPNQVLPYPGKRPYPNPLFADAGRDYDGDSLTLADEQMLWRYTYTVNLTATRTLSPLSYSDGTQYSLFKYVGGRRVPAQSFSDYSMQSQFLTWASGNGYQYIRLSSNDGPFDGLVGTVNDVYDIRDADLSKGVDGWETNPADDGDGWVSDDERDEDADGLWNYVELRGPMTAAYWKGCYTIEGAFPIEYAGTRPDDNDSDGDGTVDGADDQDHDDVPNLMEISRMRASRAHDGTRTALNDREGNVDCKVDPELLKPQDVNGDGQPDKQVLRHETAYGRVNPYNPCLPFADSRTCPRYVGFDAPFAPFDLSPDWVAIQ